MIIFLWHKWSFICISQTTEKKKESFLDQMVQEQKIAVELLLAVAQEGFEIKTTSKVQALTSQSAKYPSEGFNGLP